jgi:O-succinylbenzoic acid--CoA ligase
MEQSARMTGNYFDFHSNQRILLCLSPETIGGRMLIVRAIIHQMELVVVDVNRNPLQHINLKIDFAALVPLQVTTTLELNPSKLDLVNCLLIGGAQVDPTLVNALTNFKGKAFESFGMTETMSHIALKQLAPENQTYFEVLQGVSIASKENCLWIDAPQIGVHQLLTNDEVEIINERQFEWRGRKDFVVNSGGIKLHPEQIELKIRQFIPFRFFLTGKSDRLLGQKLVLLIESAAFDTAPLLAQLKKQLSNYEIPKEIYFCASFEETASGKINRLVTYNKLFQ